MKRVAVMALLILFASGTALKAEEAKGQGTKASGEKSEGTSMADRMASFWSRIVKSGKKKPHVPTSVAGLRGEPQDKNKEMVPYWKGKSKEKDGAAMAEIEALVNKKEYAPAIEALKTFGPSYPDSPLKPTSVLMLAYCYTQAGKNNEAAQTYEGFLKDYPSHELAADAKANLEMLKGKQTKP